MADTPIREQSALELLETHAKALEEEIQRVQSDFMRVVIANAEVAKLNAEQAETIQRLRAALERIGAHRVTKGIEGRLMFATAYGDVCSIALEALRPAAEPKPLPTESAKAAPGVMDLLELQAKTDAAVAGLNPLVKCSACGMGYFKYPMQD